MKIKTFVGIFLIFFAFLLLLYKFYEYKITKSFIDLYDKNVEKELGFLSDQSFIISDYIESMDTYYDQYGDEGEVGTDLNADALISSLDNVIDSNKRTINYWDDYINILTSNKRGYDNFKDKTKLIFGKNKTNINSIINSWDYYYDNKLESATDFRIYTYGLLEMHKRDRDYLYVYKFEDKVSDYTDNEKVNDNFYLLSSIEKYTDKNYTYPNEEEINTMNPYLHEILAKKGDFLSIYYLFMKDMLNGDEISAGYKTSTLERASKNLSVDYDRIFAEDVSQESNKDTLRALINIEKFLGELENYNFDKLPFIEDVQSSNNEYQVCNFYFFKAGVYENVTGKYPEAKNTEDLINELSILEPNSDMIDNSVNKNLIEFANNEDEASFKCLNEYNNRVLEFGHIK